MSDIDRLKQENIGGESDLDYKSGVSPLDDTNKKRQPKATRTKPNLEAQSNAIREPSRNYLPDLLETDDLVLPDDEFDWRRDGVQGQVIKWLQLGRYQSGDVIDLHGKRLHEAREIIWEFIEKSMAKGQRNVTIIHGRGERSSPPAQLKSYVGLLLKAHNDVFGFCSAPSELGGSGATLVWLRKSEEAKTDTRERHQSRRG